MSITKINNNDNNDFLYVNVNRYFLMELWRKSHAIELNLFLWGMPDNTTESESVTKHSSRAATISL